jgi:hypothetical protein
MVTTVAVVCELHAEAEELLSVEDGGRGYWVCPVLGTWYGKKNVWASNI